MRTAHSDVAEIIDLARDVYADDPAAMEVLDAAALRLREPLRLALAGIVKAGKSTLMNALVGERIAPTDAGECTRTVTWYRYANTPSIVVNLKGGGQRRLPVRRHEGQLDLDLGELTADEVSWIDIGWPAERLRSTILIDTPGIASLTQANSERSMRFFMPDDEPPAADAIIYLLRHVHSSDVSFLEAFRDTAAGSSQTVNALAVLSRADEVGSGRIDSLLSAARIADRYRRDGELRALALGVVPIAGLLAEGARTLRESEFIALRELAGLDREARERVLLSVDRFTRPTSLTSLSVDVRRGLLARFGLFGVRLGAALIRGGANTSSLLAERMVQQSGLVELQQFISHQFRARSVTLKARGVLQVVERIVREKPRTGTDAVLGRIERLASRSHDLRELALLADLRTSPVALSADDTAEAERVIGGEGTSPAARMGLPEASTGEELRARADLLLARWRALSEAPMADRYTAHLCRMVVRSVEGVASEFDRSRVDARSNVVLAGGPAESAGE